MSLVDTHAHLDFTEDVEGWCQRAKAAGVDKIICVGTSVEASKKCIEISEKYSSDDLQIYATVGIHAQDGKSDAKRYGSLGQCINTLKQLVSSSSKVVGVGETGFDIYLKGDTQQVTSNTDKTFQEELFEEQIKLAQALKLPLVIHCRNAWVETFKFLERLRGTTSLTARGSTSKSLGLFHSWTGDWETANRVLNLGFYISFSGIVTFKNAREVQEVAAKMPLEKMMIETDSPYLAPHPFRGSRNEPKNVKIVAEFIARLRNLPVDLLVEITSQNAGRLFGI